MDVRRVRVVKLSRNWAWDNTSPPLSYDLQPGETVLQVTHSYNGNYERLTLVIEGIVNDG